MVLVRASRANLRNPKKKFKRNTMKHGITSAQNRRSHALGGSAPELRLETRWENPLSWGREESLRRGWLAG